MKILSFARRTVNGKVWKERSFLTISFLEMISVLKENGARTVLTQIKASGAWLFKLILRLP